MTPVPRYFELVDDIDPGQPLAGYGCSLNLPAMRGGRVVMTPMPVRIRPRPAADEKLPGRILPGSRIVEATNPILASALEQSASFAECDPPAELQSRTSGTLTNATGGRKAAKEA